MQKQKNRYERYSLVQVILAALLFMSLGIVLELFLIGHYEDVLQLIPILCVGISILLVLVLAFRRTNFVMKLFRSILIITALSGFYGTFLHLRANYEFELEMKPGAEGWDLFRESLSGALPALAPGSMIALALIGYSYLILLKQRQ